MVEVYARLRLWCFRCNRGHLLEADEVMAHLKRRGQVNQMIVDLSRMFRCKICRRSDQVLALPASGEPFVNEPDPVKATALLVEQFFHGMRSRAKRRG